MYMLQLYMRTRTNARARTTIELYESHGLGTVMHIPTRIQLYMVH